MPTLIICSDYGKVVTVKPTKERGFQSIMWGYCDKYAKRRAVDAKRKYAQKLLESVASA